MASSKDYLEFVLEQLSELDDITYKAMVDEKAGVMGPKSIAVGEI